MSRYIDEKTVNGCKQYIVTLADPNKCKYIYNDVCCNDKSGFVADFVDEDDCDCCGLFEKEDGEGITE